MSQCECPDGFRRGIHLAEDINTVRISAEGKTAGCTFVVNQTAGVEVADETGHGRVIGTEAGFIAQGPEDD